MPPSSTLLIEFCTFVEYGIRVVVSAFPGENTCLTFLPDRLASLLGAWDTPSAFRDSRKFVVPEYALATTFRETFIDNHC
jgi:hypothetical protein